MWRYIMVIKREFDMDCEFVYDTEDNSVLELYSGKEGIDIDRTIYKKMLTEETTKEDIMEMLQ